MLTKMNNNVVLSVVHLLLIVSRNALIFTLIVTRNPDTILCLLGT